MGWHWRRLLWRTITDFLNSNGTSRVMEPDARAAAIAHVATIPPGVSCRLLRLKSDPCFPLAAIEMYDILTLERRTSDIEKWTPVVPWPLKHMAVEAHGRGDFARHWSWEKDRLSYPESRLRTSTVTYRHGCSAGTCARRDGMKHLLQFPDHWPRPKTTLYPRLP